MPFENFFTGRRHARHPSENGQRLAGREVSGEAMALRQVADAATALRIRDRHSEQRRLARGGMREAEEDLHRGRLPRPVRAKEAEQLTGLHGEVDSGKSPHLAAAETLAIGLLEAPDLDRGGHANILTLSST